MPDIISLFEIQEEKINYDNYFSHNLYSESYDKILPKDRMRIVIPSYNNFDSATLKLFASSKLEWPIDVIVRKSQEEKYNELYSANIIGIDDELINSGTKAKKYIFEHYSGDIFQFDDDLEKLCYCFPGYTDDGKLKTFRSKDPDPVKVVAMWQIIHKNLMDIYKYCWATVPGKDAFAFAFDIRDKNINLAVNSQPSAIFAVNLDRLKDYDVYIDDTISADDICTYWLALNKGLWPACIELLSYLIGKPRLEHYGKNCNSLKERFEKQTNELLAKYTFPWSERKQHKVYGNFYNTNTKLMRDYLIKMGTYPVESKIDYRELLDRQGGH